MHAVLKPPLRIQLLQRLWIRHIPDSNNLELIKWSRVSFQSLPINILFLSLKNLSSNIGSENLLLLLFTCHYVLFMLCTNWLCVSEQVFC